MLGSQLPATEKLLSSLVLEEEGETVSPVRSCQREQGTRTPVSSCPSITAGAMADFERKMGCAAREVGFGHTAGQDSTSGLERI